MVTIAERTEDKEIEFITNTELMHRNDDGVMAMSFIRMRKYKGVRHANGRISAINPRDGKRVFVSEQYITITKGAMY